MPALFALTFREDMVSFKQCVDVFSFVFFLTSPLTSYGDQILAMRRRKSSQGFSIDVCGIMLVARYPLMTDPNEGRCEDGIEKTCGESNSCGYNGQATDCSILRVFFWFGDRYALSLLFQSILMIVVQVPPLNGKQLTCSVVY